MTDPIDIKTKKKLSDNNTENNYDKAELIDLIKKDVNFNVNSWGKFQQSWCNRAFNVFKDYDKYLVLIYLFRQIMQNLSDKFVYQTYNEFYAQNEFTIEKINLTQISEELNIPKESIRRKINELQSEEILSRRGKKIILTESSIKFQQPNNTINILSKMISTKSEVLNESKDWGDSIPDDQVNDFIKKYFTIVWLRFYKLQFPFLIRHRNIFGDLETWNVWGIIAINSQYTLKKKLDKSQRDVLSDQTLGLNNFFAELVKIKPFHGINASSISDISNIPRATVIRKLKWLNKEGLIKKNSNHEFVMSNKGKKNKIINEGFLINQNYLADFLANIYDLIKNSNFKI